MAIGRMVGFGAARCCRLSSVLIASAARKGNIFVPAPRRDEMKNKLNPVE
jgi:hypothetical protein